MLLSLSIYYITQIGLKIDLDKIQRSPHRGLFRLRCDLESLNSVQRSWLGPQGV